jgi:hypothetical protein
VPPQDLLEHKLTQALGKKSANVSTVVRRSDDVNRRSAAAVRKKSAGITTTATEMVITMERAVVTRLAVESQ